MRKTETAPSIADRSFVASLQKGLDVLLCFERAHPKLTVSEAARLSGVSPASARRSLLTLVALGYLVHDGKLFWMLPKVLLLANAYLASRPTPNIVQLLLDSLAERTRESASIAKLMGDHSIIIARSTARRSLTVGLRIGSSLPAYCSATGRVLLAGLAPREAVAGPRDDAGAADAANRDDDRGGARTRAGGAHRRLAVSDGEIELDVRSMAVPDFNHAGETIAALSIAVRADRMTMAEVKVAFLPALRRAQARLREQLFED